MKFYIVDVFAEEKYQGNQLAVLIPDRDLDSGEMQKIARETNFSETTFIMSGKQENGGYHVRIFTPDFEVPFAGHPTLGTAFIIHKFIDKESSEKILLNLEVGTIPVAISGDEFTMKQNQPSFGDRAIDRNEVAGIVKINEEDIRTDYPMQMVSTGLPCMIVPLKTVDALKRCEIDHDRFRHFHNKGFLCNLLLFTPDTETGITDKDLRVRVFMEDAGFLEDPATGSANGNLAGYLLKYNYFDHMGQNEIIYNVKQGAEIGRPSLLRIKASLQDDEYDILVAGKVKLVAGGEWI